ncbi:YihY/virulence factor BrkB family protein [Aequorivita vladivostokensis]|uniref:Ribonuclease BN n=1 Tax=Aequorivita vladivostokensis TaxID=171194 RepID=A0ABR5DF84_9FLAO|nr:YihY/virulence factor BrkB family protein [Aequorivita vladivostokensis]MAB58105.1 YihY/virulence factor BrkB family protein [Aequorivita sp.]KJJ37438.1 ribonuclease BN [Aequorivita vladivostokensis]MBF30235.1 YihY/virulence factor BrkB family protein [Aequorivita sp.]MDX1782825.1 YihY/virulence factor BrkB family protein [Aequorivita vladivostokensis]HAV53688.1 YihY/virulence factor BrkB family protein [Aequorivita sp.]|tara:strand:- start:306866 stop:307822 length:957 start_codon:yes stop_codon:yes gene_type:complete
MTIFKLLKDTYLSWDKNDPWAKSAVIAYYALFSLPSLLIITVHFAGVFFGREAVEGRITGEISGLIGQGSAELIQAMIINSALSENSVLFIIFGIGVLIFGATGVFFQLQKALNDIWSVRAKKNTFLDTLKRRAVSFGMVLAIGLLLLISLIITTAINALSDLIGNYYTDLSKQVVQLLNFLFSQIIITALFATIFTLLPDVKVKWRTNLIGAFMTSLLFLAGKYLIGFYFATSDPASVYGGAGSLVLILLWVYYTCLILFFGAEFTVNWALHRNIKIEPTSNATLSYEQEMLELREYKRKVEEDKKKAEALENNGNP